ncbi:hypothetical protein JB92DRAFT_3007029 [Gautieria morchelliformis]|nr:hypothetical protein JB92DRAFT_3007029 [Gautieria morchelliformis]
MAQQSSGLVRLLQYCAPHLQVTNTIISIRRLLWLTIDMPRLLPLRRMEGDPALYSEYPDDETHKTVFLLASGDIAFICWRNSQASGCTAHQIIRLRRLSKYSNQYLYPLVGKLDTTLYRSWKLGEFTRGERDHLLLLAEGVGFEEHLVTNGCREWTSKLLRHMRDAELISRQRLSHIRTSALLPKDERD